MQYQLKGHVPVLEDFCNSTYHQHRIFQGVRWAHHIFKSSTLTEFSLLLIDLQIASKYVACA